MQDTPQISKLSLRKKKFDCKTHPKFFQTTTRKKKFSRSRNTTGLLFELYLHVQTPSFCHIVCVEGTFHTGILCKVWIQIAETVKTKFSEKF